MVILMHEKGDHSFGELNLPTRESWFTLLSFYLIGITQQFWGKMRINQLLEKF